MNNTAYVAIDRCESYKFEEIYPKLRELCIKAEMPSVSGKKILVKPNILSDSKPENCITTHPEVVRAVIRILRENGASEIYVGDSPGLHNSSFCGKNCGINDVCKDEGAIWCDFTQDPVAKRINGTRFTLPMARILDEVDMVFSVCKFKTHTLMYTTGAVKNLFGTIPHLSKGLCHAKCPTRESFARLIVGIHETIKPAFCIMDAIIGMEGAGPANGTCRPVNLLMASDNCFAMDVAQATIMDYRINDIFILNEARLRHLIPKDIVYPVLNANDLVIKDYDRVPIRRKTRFIRSLVVPFVGTPIQRMKQRREPAPQFMDEKCIRCLRCANICPAKALTLKEKADGTKHIVCDYSKCIRCYCCHEMCPVDAITVHSKEKKAE